MAHTPPPPHVIGLGHDSSFRRGGNTGGHDSSFWPGGGGGMILLPLGGGCLLKYWTRTGLRSPEAPEGGWGGQMAAGGGGLFVLKAPPSFPSMQRRM